LTVKRTVVGLLAVPPEPPSGLCPGQQFSYFESHKKSLKQLHIIVCFFYMCEYSDAIKLTKSDPPLTPLRLAGVTD